VVDSDSSDDDVIPQSVSSSFPSSQSMMTTMHNEDFTMNGLKSHLVQNLAKKLKVPSGPLSPQAPLPMPPLCPCTFLASLILTSKFTQDRCYSNKAWAKLSVGHLQGLKVSDSRDFEPGCQPRQLLLVYFQLASCYLMPPRIIHIMY